MATPLLPNFAGDPNSARDILDYLVDPANAGLIDLDTRLTALTAAVALKVEHAAQESAPTSASAGWFWTKASTGVTYYCSATYSVGEPDPDSKWTAVTDTSSLAMVKAMSQINSPTPQVSLLSATISGFGSDLSISTAEKATVKILYDEMVQRKIEIDLNAVRYGVTGEADYTDYVTKYNALVSYVTTTGVLGNLNVATTIASSSDWTTNWTEAINAEGAAIALLRSEQQDLLDAIDGNADSALAQLSAMSADGIISAQEKLFYRREWTRVQDEYAKLSAKATEYAQTGATQWTTLAATYSALTTYLGTTTAVFTSMTTNTVLADVGSNSTEWNSKWQSYYADALVFDNYIDTYFSELLDAQDATLLSLTNSIAALADDGVITGGAEKQSLKKSYDDLVRLHNRVLYQAAQYSVATPSSYTTAYDALVVHLNTTLDIFSNMNEDTTINRAVFNSKFSDYYFQYDAFTDAVVLAQKADVDAEPADYQDYKDLIDAIVDDGIVTAGAEKTRFNAIWLDIQATQSIVVAKGTKSGANTTALVAAYNDLSTYIGTLTKPGGGSPNFTIEGEDTAIGISTFHGKMRAYEAAKAQLESDIISQLIELQAGNARSILDMNDDGIVSVSEKGSLYKDWLKETAEKSQLDAQATLLSITTEKTNMDSAYTTLETFLNGLQGGDGLFDDLTIATTLTTPQKDAWDGHWNLYFTTKATLQTTIIATIQGNTSALGTSAFRKDGTVAATGDFNMGMDYSLYNVKPKTLTSGSLWVATNGQVYTEQQARILHEGTNTAHGVTGTIVGTTDNQTLTTKTINADNNSISNLEADNLKAGVVETDVMASTTVDDSTWPSTKATKKAVVDHAALTNEVHGLAAGVTVVGTSTEQTLTNKTLGTGTVIDFDNVTASNIEVADLKSTAVATSIGTPGVDTKLATEKAVRDMYASVTSAIDAAVAAIGEDYGCHLTDIQTGTGTSWTAALIGTRIDTSSPSYAASTFNFAFQATMGYNSPRTDDAETVGSYVISLRGFIKKAVGAEPYCYLLVNVSSLASGGGADSFANALAGTLSTSGTTLTADFDSTYSVADSVSIERVDSSNELCFRLSCVLPSITDFNAMMVMTGPRKYTGTLITSSNGTVF